MSRKINHHVKTGLEKLSDEEKNAVIDLLSEGNSLEKTVKKTGVSIHYVRLIKRTYHLPDASRRKTERNRQIVEMREKEGLSYEAIAKKIGDGITRQRVYYIYHRDSDTLGVSKRNV